jgi:hypothetical protein
LQLAVDLLEVLTSDAESLTDDEQHLLLMCGQLKRRLGGLQVVKCQNLAAMARRDS